MKQIYRFFLFVLLGVFMALAGCGQIDIGEVRKLTATVEAGPAGALVEIAGSATLHSGDNIRISGGHGRARLTLVDGTVIIELYDATNSEISDTGVGGSPAAMAFLSQGGLTASVSQGSTCTVDVPNGGTFYILGTEAFIIFNPETRFTTAGNFKGTVKWDSAEVKGQTLEEGTMVDIGPAGEAYPPYPMPFGIDEFNKYVTDLGSPIETMTVLRDTYGIPQPGQQPQPGFQELPLFTYDGQTVVPVLAQEIFVESAAANGSETYTFFLSQDLRLQNGEPFTAPLVAKTFIEKATPDALKGVEITTKDDLTLVIQFFRGSNRSLLDELSKILFPVQR